MFRRRGEETTQPFLDTPPRHLEAMQLRYRSVKFANRACRIFIFAERYKLETRPTSKGCHIGNTNKDDLMSS